MYLSGRLVKYALFLYDWIFPLLLPFYEEEGRLLRAYLAGDEAANVALSKKKGTVEARKEAFFAQH